MNSKRPKKGGGFKKIFYLFVMAMLAFNFSIAPVLASPEEDILTVEPLHIDGDRPASAGNPELTNSCGIDIALIIDSSKSMEGDPLLQEKAAFIDFIDAFLPNTLSEVAVVDFASDAEVIANFTTDAIALKSKINLVDTTYGDFTNWEAALATAHNLFLNREKPDLIVFASDGNPNLYIGADSLRPESDSVNKAIIEANNLKADGIRIITLGMGNNVDAQNLIDISSPDAYYNSDFNNLAATLAGIADQLCGGTITVKKYVDNIATDGWQFAAEVFSGTVNENIKMTGGGGLATFEIENIETEATVNITETVQPGFNFTNAICKIDNQEILVGVSTSTASVSNIPVSSTDQILCEFYNETASVPAINIGDIVITEIMSNPVGVNDDEGEWFELYNATNGTIELNGCLIKDDGTDDHIINGSIVVSAGGYAVLGRNNDVNLNGGVNLDYQYSGVILGNSGDEIVLMCENIEIDRVNYSNGLGFPDSNNLVGASMILGSPNLDNNIGGNWCVSTSIYGNGDLGTPGQANDSCGGLVCTDTDNDNYFFEGGDCGPVDCDDANAAVNPAVSEICNNQTDDNCNGQIDENCGGGQTTGNIFGVKFNDLNLNAVWDAPNEASLGGWQIRLFSATDLVNPIATATTTDVAGYSFNNLALGDYAVMEVNQTGWAQTVPTTTDIITLTEVNNSFELNFGNTQYSTCADVDQDGYDNCAIGDYGDDGNAIDCNDGDLLINPGAQEICADGIDNNCDGQIDEQGCFTPVCVDNDGDGYGAYCELGLDCDDTDATVYPGAVEIFYDNIDQNCDGMDLTDVDGDEYIDSSVTGGNDCNDNNNSVNPGANEVCGDGIDNNCDGNIDEGCNNGGSGGGGGGGIPALYIHTERTDDIDTSSILVTWFTNKPATSRVVYGTSPADPIGPWPNLGYQNSTVEDIEKVLFHSVTIVGLTPETTYYLRPISAASPEVYGMELTVATAAEPSAATPETPPISPITPTPPVNEPESGEQQSGINEQGGTVGTPGISTEETPDEGTIGSGEEAAEGEVLGEKVAFNNGDVQAEDEESEDGEEEKESSCFADWWWLILLLLLVIAYLAYENYRKTEGKSGEQIRKND